MAAGVLFVANGVGAEEKKAPKADVVVKKGEKIAKAKSGETVEVQVDYPVVPPFPEKLEVKVDGKKVEAKEYSARVLVDGKPVVGVGRKVIQFKATGDGKQKVVVEYKKGDATEKVEIELEVAK